MKVDALVNLWFKNDQRMFQVLQICGLLVVVASGKLVKQESTFFNI